jgi:hypothetical protein
MRTLPRKEEQMESTALETHPTAQKAPDAS